MAVAGIIAVLSVAMSLGSWYMRRGFLSASASGVLLTNVILGVVAVTVLRPTEPKFDHIILPLILFANMIVVPCCLWTVLACWLWGKRRTYNYDGRPRCGKCGYDLTGNVSGVCPECGTEVEGPRAKAEVNR